MSPTTATIATLRTAVTAHANLPRFNRQCPCQSLSACPMSIDCEITLDKDVAKLRKAIPAPAIILLGFERWWARLSTPRRRRLSPDGIRKVVPGL